MNLTQNTELNKGISGVKRSSWKRIHFRDLALKVCEDQPDATIEELAESFLAELQRFPEYMQSIAVYIMANVRASLSAGRPRRSDSGSVLQQAAITNIARKVAARALMEFELPNGKLLRESTGAECVKAGGWLKRIGEAVGPTGIVGQKLTEAKLRSLLKGADKR